MRNFSIVTTLIGSLLFLITSLNQSVVQRLTVHLHFLTRQKMCLKKERHDSVIIFLFVCCTSTLGLPGPNRVCRWSPQLTLINHSIQKRNHPALQSDKLASPRDQRKAHNHRQIAFDPGVMSHSEVTMFSRCQGRFFCNLFSAVDCLSFLLHPPPPPHFGCCLHPCY